MVAGNVANTNIYETADKQSHIDCQKMFEEQIGWAKEAGVDFVIAETISWTGEAQIALKAIKDAGMIAVVNLAVPAGDKTRDGHSVGEACKILEDHGADVVGLNCYRGPTMMKKLLPEIKRSVSCHVAALPVPFRTNEKYPTFMYIKDEGCDCIDGNVSHIALDGLTCTRFEMGNFAKDCAEMNVNFIGICCGADPHHVREMAVSLGRKPIAYQYYPDMDKHFAYGKDKQLKKINDAKHLKL